MEFRPPRHDEHLWSSAVGRLEKKTLLVALGRTGFVIVCSMQHDLGCKNAKTRSHLQGLETVGQCGQLVNLRP